MNTTPRKPYNWKDHGYIILIQEDDAERTLDEICDACTLLDIFWEGIMLRGGFLVDIDLAGKQYGLVFVILDAPWVSDELRRLIEDTPGPLPEPGSLNR
jgi:hypothetical protein